MTRVSAKAMGYSTTAQLARSGAPVRPRMFDISSRPLALTFVVALMLCLAAPADVAALGVLLFGPLHIVQELRRVVHAERRMLSLAWAWSGLATALLCVGCRLLGLSPLVEITLATGLAAIVIARSWDDLGNARAILLGSTLGALVIVSAQTSLWWFVVLSHAHNLLPVLVALRSTDRRRATALAFGYLLIVALVLTGALDGLLARGYQHPLTLFGDQLVSADAARVVTPPGLGAGWSSRWLTVFLFAQLVHYALWCGLLRPHPSEQPSDQGRTRKASATVISVFAAMVVSGALLIVAFRSAASARSAYASIAVFHVIVELPALSALLGRNAPLTLLAVAKN